MNISQLKVCALLYHVTARHIRSIYVDENNISTEYTVSNNEIILPKVELLKEELLDTVKIARGRTPRLQEFMKDWGKLLIPEKLTERLPDILVVIPHSFLHGIPIHLVCLENSGLPLWEECGISYCSSMTLFVQCTKRNYIRNVNLSNWEFDIARRTHTGCPSPETFFGGSADLLGDQETEFKRVVNDVRSFFEKKTKVNDQRPLSRDFAKVPFRRDYVDVVMLMAHGILDELNHMHSGILLYHNPNFVAINYVWRLSGPYEIRDLPQKDINARIKLNSKAEILTSAELALFEELSTRLVVLLACSSGSDKVVIGDEPASIAETYLKIGAPSVIAPGWDSHYPTSRKWIYRFFEGWVTLGLPKALAVQYAAQKMATDCPGVGYAQTGALCLRGDWL
jgi:CHAT domain-containing protein